MDRVTIGREIAMLLFAFLVLSVSMSTKILIGHAPFIFQLDYFREAFILVSLLSLWALFNGIKWTDFDTSLKVIMISVIGVLGITYCFPVTLVPTVSESTSISEYRLFYFPLICFILLSLSVFKPIFGLFLVLLVYLQKETLEDYSNISLSSTEWVPLLEVFLFIFFSISLMKFVPHSWRSKLGINTRNERDFFLYTLLYAVALHFANYFWSGAAKLKLGEGIFSWITQNETYLLVSSGDIINAAWYPKLGNFYDLTLPLIIEYNSEINIITLLTQLLALVALKNIRFAIILTFMFDIFHLGIYFLSGIFFYKWMILNVAIVLALRHYKHEGVSFSRFINLSIFILCVNISINGFKPLFVANLGWWDTPVFNYQQVVAVFKDGEQLPVPSNFFGSYSITHAQRRYVGNVDEFIWQTGTFGNTNKQQIMMEAQNCNQVASSDIFASDTSIDEDELKKMATWIFKSHEYALYKENKNAGYNYDFRPHHIPSIPRFYEEFKARKVSDVDYYKLEVKAYCTTILNGKLSRRIIGEYHEKITF